MFLSWQERRKSKALAPSFLPFSLPLLGPVAIRAPRAAFAGIVVVIPLLLEGEIKAEGKRRGPREEEGSLPKVRRRDEGRTKTKTRKRRRKRWMQRA
jgi:hypothetical protein